MSTKNSMNVNQVQSSNTKKNARRKSTSKNLQNHGFLPQDLERQSSIEEKKRDLDSEVPRGFKSKMRPKILMNRASTKPYVVDKSIAAAINKKQESINTIQRPSDSLNHSTVTSKRDSISKEESLKKSSSTLYNSAKSTINVPVITSTITSGAYANTINNHNSVLSTIMSSHINAENILYNSQSQGREALNSQPSMEFDKLQSLPLQYKDFDAKNNKENTTILTEKQLNALLQSGQLILSTHSPDNLLNQLTIELPATAFHTDKETTQLDNIGMTTDTLLPVQPNDFSLYTAVHNNIDTNETALQNHDFSENDGNTTKLGSEVPSDVDSMNEHDNDDPDIAADGNEINDIDINEHGNPVNAAGYNINNILDDDRRDSDPDIAPENNQINDVLNNDHRHIGLNEVYHSDNCCEACRMHCIETKNKLNSIESKLDSIINNRNILPARENLENFNLLPVFPIDTLADLEKFDADLQLSEPMQNQFERKATSLGGDGLRRIANNIMSLVMTDQLAKNLTWVANVENKTAISLKFFINLIIRFIRKSNPDFTENEIRKVMQKWIQKPSDRIANKNRKEQRRQQLQAQQ